MSDKPGRDGVHPAVWIVLFFITLAILQASFYVVALRLPDDSLPPPPSAAP